jgi:anti-sigma B factor antagonist
MDVNVKTLNDILIICVEGNIDSKTSPELQQKIVEATLDANKIIIDMSKVEFVSSAGLRVLLMVYRQIKTNNGTVVLVGVSEEIKEVMSMTGFINFFKLYESLDASYCAFNS